VLARTILGKNEARAQAVSKVWGEAGRKTFKVSQGASLKNRHSKERITLLPAPGADY